LIPAKQSTHAAQNPLSAAHRAAGGAGGAPASSRTRKSRLRADADSVDAVDGDRS